ncbi:chromate resistance exported protein [Caballeronia pedi]|uniref:Chromate resistance exported protein n=1 Tax=Caballeronia pedi TaxID=1777141 RepID=A0A158DMV0_9BURK|nr:chromate resistance exported protein [Caballeronia pedi]
MLRDGIYLLPYSVEREATLRELSVAIGEAGGTAYLLRAPSLDAEQDVEFRGLFAATGRLRKHAHRWITPTVGVQPASVVGHDQSPSNPAIRSFEGLLSILEPPLRKVADVKGDARATNAFSQPANESIVTMDLQAIRTSLRH